MVFLMIMWFVVEFWFKNGLEDGEIGCHREEEVPVAGVHRSTLLQAGMI